MQVEEQRWGACFPRWMRGILLRFRIVTEQDRIRPHIRIFVNDQQTQEPSGRSDRVYIVCALSGG